MKKFFGSVGFGERRVVWRRTIIGRVAHTVDRAALDTIRTAIKLPGILAHGRRVQPPDENQPELERLGLIGSIKKSLMSILGGGETNEGRRALLVKMARSAQAIAGAAAVVSAPTALTSFLIGNEEHPDFNPDFLSNEALVDEITNQLQKSSLDQVRDWLSEFAVFDAGIMAVFVDFVSAGVKGTSALVPRFAAEKLGVGMEKEVLALARCFDDDAQNLVNLREKLRASVKDEKAYYKFLISKEALDDTEKMELAYLTRENVISGIPGISGSSLMTVAGLLGLKAVVGTKQDREEVGHTIVETGLGVGLLGGMAMLAEKSIINDPTLPRVTAAYEASKENVKEKSDAVKMDNTFKHLFDSVSNSYWMSSLSIFSTAFGTASLMGKRFLKVANTFVPDMLALVKGKTVNQCRTMINELKNPYLKDKFTEALKGLDNDVVIDESINAKLETRFIKDFSFELIGTMDRAQIGLGDIGPFVGACQSFGVWEAIKSGTLEWLINGVAVQSTLSTCMLHKKFGFEYKDTSCGIKEGAKYAWRTFLNLIPGMGLNKADEDALREYAKTGKVPWDTIDKGSSVMRGKGIRSGVGGMVKVAGHSLTTLGDAIKGGAMQKPHEHARMREVYNALEEIEVRLKNEDSGKETESKEHSNGNGLEHFLHDFEEFAEVDETSADELKAMKEGLAEMQGKITELFEEKAKEIEGSEKPAEVLANFLRDFKPVTLKEVIGFHNFEHKFGAVTADTIFNVMIQGLCLTSITKIIGKVYDLIGLKDWPYMVKLSANCLIHAALSAVADNWGDQIVNANHMFKYFGVPEVAKKHNIDTRKMNLDAVPKDGPSVTGKYEMFLTEATKDIDNEEKKKEIYFDTLKEYIIGKHISLAISAAGGELTLIGNSPHFLAFIKNLKDHVNMKTSLERLAENLPEVAAKIQTAQLAALAAAEVEYLASKAWHSEWSFEQLMKEGPLKSREGGAKTLPSKSPRVAREVTRRNLFGALRRSPNQAA